MIWNNISFFLTYALEYIGSLLFWINYIQHCNQVTPLFVTFVVIHRVSWELFSEEELAPDFILLQRKGRSQLFHLEQIIGWLTFLSAIAWTVTYQRYMFLHNSILHPSIVTFLGHMQATWVVTRMKVLLKFLQLNKVLRIPIGSRYLSQWKLYHKSYASNWP